MEHKLLQKISEVNKTSTLIKTIIRHFINNGSSTITDLAKELEFSIPTVTKFISEMCDDGFLNEYGKLETNGGRHPSLYGLNPDSGYFIGVEMKQHILNIGLINFKGEMMELKSDIPFDFKNSPEALDRLCNIIKDFIKEINVEEEKVLNICLSISGRVNPDTGYSFSAFNFSERPLTEIMEEKIGHPVCIDNDSRVMTYGEYLAGNAQNAKDVIFVNVSQGLGIGIIIDGKMYTGKSGFAGEFGHINSFDNEILCHCGKKGCIETEASGAALKRIVTERIQNGETSILSKRVSEKETPLTLMK